MSEPERRATPPPDRVLPVLGTVAYVAVVIAAWGFTSLFLGRDVIEEADAGPLLGPAMVLAACVTTAGFLLRMPRTARPWRSAAAAAASAYVISLVVGGIGMAITRGSLLWVVLFGGRHAGSPFVLELAVLAGATVAGYAGLLALGARQGGSDGGRRIDRNAPGE
jgi:hypothetical protein